MPAHNLLTAVGYQWRYFDLVERARDLLAEQPLLLAQGYWLSTAPKTDWWHDPALSGGQIYEQATHMIDLCRWFLGEPSDLYAAMAPDGSNSRVPAATAVTLRFGDVPATIICGCALPVRYRCGFVLHTEKYIIELFSRASGMMNVGMTIKTSDGIEEFSPARDPVLQQDEAFLTAVRSGDPSSIRCDYADAVKTLAISSAAQKSRDQGAAVKMPAPVA